MILHSTTKHKVTDRKIIPMKINTKEIRQKLMNSNDKHLMALEKGINEKDLKRLVTLVRKRTQQLERG